jgi:hypothetical protein
MHRMNQIGFCGGQHWPEHFDDLRIVVFSSRRIICAAQIVMYLGYRDAIVFSRYCPVVGRIKRRGLVMSNHLHMMAGPARAHG